MNVKKEKWTKYIESFLLNWIQLYTDITYTFQCTISTHELSNYFQKETEDHRKYMHMPTAPFQHNLFECDGDSVHLKSSFFHSKYSYVVDGTTHSRTEQKIISVLKSLQK